MHFRPATLVKSEVSAADLSDLDGGGDLLHRVCMASSSCGANENDAYDYSESVLLASMHAQNTPQIAAEVVGLVVAATRIVPHLQALSFWCL